MEFKTISAVTSAKVTEVCTQRIKDVAAAISKHPLMINQKHAKFALLEDGYTLVLVKSKTNPFAFDRILKGVDKRFVTVETSKDGNTITITDKAKPKDEPKDPKEPKDDPKGDDPKDDKDTDPKDDPKDEPKDGKDPKDPKDGNPKDDKDPKELKEPKTPKDPKNK